MRRLKNQNIFICLIFNIDKLKQTLNSLSKSEKKYFTHLIIRSKMERYLIDRIDLNELLDVLGKANTDRIVKNGAKRQIKTLENINFSNLLVSAFDLKQIKYVFLKGLSSYANALSNYSVRQIFDIDLLIDHQDLKSVLDICSDHGFNTERWASKNINKVKIYRNPTLKHSNQLALIDIHPYLFKQTINGYTYDEHIIKNSVKSKDPKFKGFYCSKETLFIHTLYHGTAKNIFNEGPVYITDMVSMLKDKEIIWGEVIEQSKILNLYQPLIDNLSGLDQFIDIPLDLKPLLNKPTTLPRKKIVKLLFSKPESSSINIEKISQKNNIFQKILQKITLKQSYATHDDEKFNLKIYIKFLKNLIIKNFLYLISNKNVKTQALRANYSKSLKSIISKPES